MDSETLAEASARHQTDGSTSPSNGSTSKDQLHDHLGTAAQKRPSDADKENVSDEYQGRKVGSRAVRTNCNSFVSNPPPLRTCFHSHSGCTCWQANGAANTLQLKRDNPGAFIEGWGADSAALMVRAMVACIDAGEEVPLALMDGAIELGYEDPMWSSDESDDEA